MGLLRDVLPDWLPDDPNKADAARAGLLNFGAAMLQGRGNFGQALGGGIAAGSQGYSNALEDAQKQALQQGQLKILQNKDSREQMLQQFVSNKFAGGIQPTGVAPVNPLIQGGTIGPTVANAQRMGPAQGVPAGFPMTLNEVAALKAMGGPDMMDAYKFANEGVERKQGSTYIDPSTGLEKSYAKLGDGQVQGRDGSVSNAPGYVGALSASEAAKADAVESAKANYDLLDPTKFVGADGRPIPATRAGYIASIGSLPKKGGPVSLPPVKQPAPAGFPTVSRQEQQTRDGGRLQILQTELDATTNPADRAALQREIARTRQQVGAPVLQSAAEAKAQLGAVDTTIEAGKGLNSNWIKEVHNPVQAEGKAARTTLAQLETIKNIDFKTGWGAEAQTAAASILATLGIKDAEKYASKAQSFQQVAMERNMTMLQAQTGPQTEGDSQRAQQTFLKLSNTPQANQFIADLTAANARLAARRAQYYNDALPHAKANGDFTEIDRRWSKVAPSIWSDPALSKYKVK